VYLAHVLKPDYSDAAFPYWRLRMEPGRGNRTHCTEGTWGAQIIDELTPQEDEHLVAITAISCGEIASFEMLGCLPSHLAQFAVLSPN